MNLRLFVCLSTFSGTLHIRIDSSGVQCSLMLLTRKGQRPDKSHRTLFWMASREGVAVPGFSAEDTAFQGFVSVQRVARRMGASDVSAQLRVERLYHKAKGGLLADSVGYGKTASILGLVAFTRQSEAPPLQRNPFCSSSSPSARRCGRAPPGSSAGAPLPPPKTVVI